MKSNSSKEEVKQIKMAAISDLSVGKYKLVEKESLPGYKKLTEPVSFEITKRYDRDLIIKNRKMKW